MLRLVVENILLFLLPTVFYVAYAMLRRHLDDGSQQADQSNPGPSNTGANVGNVLNSVNVASSCLADSLRRSKSANLSKVVALMHEHEADLGALVR